MTKNISNINCNRSVVKKNDFILKMPTPRTLQSMKAAALCIALINSRGKAFKGYYAISFKQAAFFLGLQKSHNYKKQITRAFNEANVPTWQITKNIAVKLWSSLEFRTDGYIELEFSQKLKKYLTSITGHFTRYQLWNVLVLNSTYSIRMYELMKMYKTNKIPPIINLDELRKLLNVTAYPKYKDFKRRILIPCRNDLYNFTDIGFNYIELQGNKGKAVQSIQFNIYDTKCVKDKIIKERFERLRMLQDIFTAKTTEELQLPIDSPNTPRYDNVFIGFQNTKHNYPSSYTFDQYCNDNDFNIVKNGKGFDISIQAKLAI